MHIRIRNLGIASALRFFSSPRGGHGRRKKLMVSHPYGYETPIFTLVAPHEGKRRAGKQNFTHVLPWAN